MVFTRMSIVSLENHSNTPTLDRDEHSNTNEQVPLLHRRTSSEDRNDEFSYLDDKNELNSIALLPGYLDDGGGNDEDNDSGIDVDDEENLLFQDNDQLRYRSSTAQNL